MPTELFKISKLSRRQYTIVKFRCAGVSHSSPATPCHNGQMFQPKHGGILGFCISCANRGLHTIYSRTPAISQQMEAFRTALQKHLLSSTIPSDEDEDDAVLTDDQQDVTPQQQLQSASEAVQAGYLTFLDSPVYKCPGINVADAGNPFSKPSTVDIPQPAGRPPVQHTFYWTPCASTVSFRCGEVPPRYTCPDHAYQWDTCFQPADASSAIPDTEQYRQQFEDLASSATSSSSDVRSARMRCREAILQWHVLDDYQIKVDEQQEAADQPPSPRPVGLLRLSNIPHNSSAARARNAAQQSKSATARSRATARARPSVSTESDPLSPRSDESASTQRSKKQKTSHMPPLPEDDDVFPPLPAGPPPPQS